MGATGPPPAVVEAGALAQGQPAPDFSAPTFQGSRLSLGGLRGRPVLINFFASWCTVCEAELPGVEQAYRAHQAEGFTVVGVNTLENGDGPAFYHRLGLTFPAVHDPGMYDRQTESWWQQAIGQAIVGDLTGTQLTILPAGIVSWDVFRTAHPEGTVLSRDTGFGRSYGINPYTGYDQANTQPFLFEGSPDGRLAPKEHVVTVSLGGEDVAYPYAILKKWRVVQDTVGGTPIVVL